MLPDARISATTVFGEVYKFLQRNDGDGLTMRVHIKYESINSHREYFYRSEALFVGVEHIWRFENEEMN